MIKLKSVFIVIYLALMLLMLLSLKADAIVWFSFFFSSLVLLFITIYHLYFEKEYSPFLSSYIVFTFLFFLAAPISQVNSFNGLVAPKFITFFPYKEWIVIYTNTLISVFNIIFIIAYIRFKNYFLKSQKKEKKYLNDNLLPFTIFAILVLSSLVFFTSYGFIQDELLRPSWLNSKTSVSMLLTWKKFLFFIPLAGIAMCFKYFQKRNKSKSNLINVTIFLIFLLVLLFWFKNPLTEKRNALGPIYITLIFLFVPKVLNTNIKTVSFLFFSMIVVFPLMAILTHSDATILEIYRNPSILIAQMKGGGVTKAFATLNYDAFANIGASIDYIHKFGFSYGYQLLGGLLFFLPRSLWVSKPISSGELIGEHLVHDFGFGFTNLSNSFVSESFINFGVIGVLITPLILAFILIKMIGWLSSESYLKKTMAFYFSIHLIFLLRGDFTNGFSYYISPLIAVLAIPKLIELIILELSRLYQR